jgi:concanavalin A-like lectin/glucanase superfamily protein
VLSFFAFLSVTSDSEAIQDCDSARIRQCIGRALTIERTSGDQLQYIVVTRTESWDWLDEEMTLEMFIKPEREAGKVQFIAGRWGPGRDINDQWVLYLAENEDLVFEINGSGTNLGGSDNTIVRIPGGELYDNWNHIAAVFDGTKQMAYLFINGVVQDSARNEEYPASRLRPIANDGLPMLIGSANALTNDFDLFRTMKGQMDEIRLWSIAIDPFTLKCRQGISYNDKYPDMVLYYRCNEYPDVFDLCDVTGNGNFGKCLNGAICQPNDRTFVHRIIGDVTPIFDTLYCDNKKTYYFTVQDTTDCGSRMWIRMLEDVDTNYTWQDRYHDLPPHTPVTIPITFESNMTGTYKTRFQILTNNRCGTFLLIPMTITRITSLKKSTNNLDFGMEYARCVNKRYIDSVITIYNTTDQSGVPRALEVFSMTTRMPDVFRVMSPAAPFTLPPGGRQDITLRYFPGDTTAFYMDTLKIVSQDTCKGSGDIALFAHSQEVISISEADGETRLDSIFFKVQCKGFVSPPYNYLWRNLIDVDIEVIDVIFPTHFIGNPFDFPEVLEAEDHPFPPNYFRSNPQAGGIFRDSIVFIIDANGCRVEHPIYVYGEGFFADIGFVKDSVDFGDVIIGQSRQLGIDVFNNSDEALNISFYMRRGKVYFFGGSRQISIPAGKIGTIPLDFIPTDEEEYLDEICLFDRRCLTSACIPVRGRGVLERFRFEPEVMYTKNVIGCQSQLDTLAIFNNTSSPVTMTKFVFDNMPDIKYLLEYPNPLPSSINLAGNDSTTFIFSYAPNDLTTDRADRAYLRYETSDGADWSANLYGTSSTPRIFVSYETVFGVVEVADTKLDTVMIENSSAFPITIDSVAVNNGFVLINIPSGYIGRKLNPRDTMRAIVEFTPMEDKAYSGELFVYSSDPCEVEYNGVLTGRGIIVPLEVPLSVISFGYTSPCNCVERKILLVNSSLVFPRSVDSIWIDGEGLPNATPEFFSWRSYSKPDGIMPYDVDAKSRDTLYVKFCPRTPAERQYIDNEARVHVKASGPGWVGDEYDTYLIGKRQMTMEPSPIFVQFPWTPVDITSLDRMVQIVIPEVEVNPNRENIVLDSVSFLPDERVFTAQESLGEPFPIEIDSIGVIELAINFKPRSPRQYDAKLVLHFSEPCKDLDTTVALSGRGTALPFDLQFTFNLEKEGMDTLRVAYCDTLLIPVYSTREIPATVVDIRHRIGYDDANLTYLDTYSKYMESQNTCENFTPDITAGVAASGGTEFLLKNFCHVDSLDPVSVSRFVPNIQDRDTFKIYLDSLFFDTEDIIYYEVLARPDSAIVVVLKPEMMIDNSIDFGVVDVLDYRDSILMIINTGDTEITFDEILNLPSDVEIINSVPPIGAFFDVGDTAYVTLRFSPRRKQVFDTTAIGLTDLLCPLMDSTTIAGEGYAPEFPVAIDVSANFTLPDTLNATLGDTIDVPILFEKDFSREIRGVMYWLQDLRFDVNLKYNPRALKYLEHESLIDSESDFQYQHGNIVFSYESVDTLQAGEIASVKFLVIVPDSVSSGISLDSRSFNTDSILFLDIIPMGTESVFIANGKLNLTYLNFGDSPIVLMQNSPNPWQETTTINFSLDEELPVSLRIMSQQGDLVSDLLEGVKILPKGDYKAELNSAELQSGLYYYELRAGGHVVTKKMILIK